MLPVPQNSKGPTFGTLSEIWSQIFVRPSSKMDNEIGIHEFTFHHKQ